MFLMMPIARRGCLISASMAPSLCSSASPTASKTNIHLRNQMASMLCEDDNLLSLCRRALLLIVCLSLNRPSREGRVDNALKESHGIINVQG